MKKNTITFNTGYRTYEGEIEESGEFITPLQKENYIFEYSMPINFIKIDTESNMSTFENKLYEDTQAEIARLEEELNFLRQFLKLVGSSSKKPTKSISKPSTKNPRAKSAQKKVKPKTCGRIMVGSGTDMYDPVCELPKGHKGICKSRSAVDQHKLKPKVTKSGKKIGRPTNAEKEAEILEYIDDNGVNKDIAKFEETL